MFVIEHETLRGKVWFIRRDIDTPDMIGPATTMSGRTQKLEWAKTFATASEAYAWAAQSRHLENARVRMHPLHSRPLRRVMRSEWRA